MARVIVYKVYEVGECVNEQEAIIKGKKAFIDDLGRAMENPKRGEKFSFDVDIIDELNSKED